MTGVPESTSEEAASNLSTDGSALVHVVRILDGFSGWCGRAVMWLVIPLVVALVYEVIARYWFGAPTDWAFDVSWMLYSAHFMLGAAYTLSRGEHVRTDFVYQKLPVRAQGALDAALYVVVFFPAIAIFAWYGGEYAMNSWLQRERVVTSAWLPPVYPIKAVIPMSAALLLVQGLSELTKSLHAARTGEWL